MNTDEIRGSIYAADREQMEDALLAVLDIIRDWYEGAVRDFGDASLSGTAARAELVADAITKALGERDD